MKHHLLLTASLIFALHSLAQAQTSTENNNAVLDTYKNSNMGKSHRLPSISHSGYYDETDSDDDTIDDENLSDYSEENLVNQLENIEVAFTLENLTSVYYMTQYNTL
jgi:hypothetical protein